MKPRLTVPVLLSALLACAGCGPASDPVVTGTAVELRVDPWPLPVPADSHTPDLVPHPDGGVVLAWTHRLGGDGHALDFAREDRGQWTPPVRIAQGTDWFVNWADTPHLALLPDGSLWAQWLQRTGEGRYDYGIALARSGDGGASWTRAAPVHPQGLRLDFGFASLWAAADDRLGIAWLDSRHRQEPTGHGHGAAQAHDHAHANGVMALYATTVGPDGEPAPARLLDEGTCDCCPTATAGDGDDLLLAYRARRAGEIRDIHVVAARDGHWGAPVEVAADGWSIAGCPVNGPAIARNGDRVWVAWPSERDGEPVVRLARSDDGGASFHPALDWRAGPGQLGRTAIAAGRRSLWWAWMEEDDQGQRLLLATAAQDADPRSARVVEVARLAARGRASGFPRLLADDTGARVVWTDVEDGRPVLRGARVAWSRTAPQG